MKALSPHLRTHLDGTATTLARCWRVTRADGTVLGFTDHDQDLVIGGVTYLAGEGWEGSDTKTTLDLRADNQDVKGVLGTVLTEQDVLAGLYDHARVDVFDVDWTAPPAQAVPGEVLWVKTGRLVRPKAEAAEGRFSATLAGLTDLLNQEGGETVSRLCRARFGDDNCRVNLMAWSYTVALVAGEGELLAFADPVGQIGYFTGGEASFESGANRGWTGIIAASQPGLVTLYQPPPLPVSGGETVKLVAGCDKTLGTCAGKFNNARNYWGFPHLPGTDRWMSGK